MRSWSIFISIALFWRKHVETLFLDPLVFSDVGFIRGLMADDGDYFMFLGIPYATVDENNPFGAAIPEPHFEKHFNADDESKFCPQNYINKEKNQVSIGALDCLTLSIFVPYSILTLHSVPVIVWLHGGRFLYGSSSTWIFGPKYLVKHDVIVVSVNYRLGIYGFMCLNIPDAPGNQGLKDQVLALKWIKKHISRFGGDVNSITVMGESSGSTSADLHLHSNHENLFHRSIMQGGSTYTMLSDLKRNDTLVLLKLASELGLVTNNTFEALSYVKRIDSKLVTTASEKLFHFIPCLEDASKNGEAFISESPINLDVPKVQNISILIGFNANDQFSKFLKKTPEFYKNWDGFMDGMNSHFIFDETHQKTMVEILKKFYLKHQEINYNARFKIAEFTSDLKMMHPIQRTIDKYIRNGAKNVFQYMFSYVGSRNIVSGFYNDTEIGAVHADELGYLFSTGGFFTDEFFPGGLNTTVTAEDQLIIDRMTTMWTNFAKYGDPTPEVSELLPIRWKPITKDDSRKYYLNIGTTMSLDMYPYHSRMAFWDLFYELNKKCIRGLTRIDNNI